MADAVESASPGALELPPDRKLIAPLWHTILLLLIILGISALSYFTTRQISATSIKLRLITYLATVGQEWLLFLYVYAGIRARGVTVRRLINARWASGRDVWRDIGIAAVVLVLFWTIAGISSVIFRSAGATGAKVVQQLTPHAAIELPVWILLSVSAGFCEEFIFRGYLQEQSKRLTGSVGAAVVVQALFFGLGHGYQGWASMLTISVIGLLFGAAAARQNSLAPAMIAHASADSFAGLAAFAARALHKI